MIADSCGGKHGNNGAPPAELMQTELHHIQTLTVMSEVFRRGMLEELQLDLECVAKVFPCLDPLLLFHRSLFGAMQDCRHATAQPDNPRNYLIQQIGDVLLQQVGVGHPRCAHAARQPHVFIVAVMTPPPRPPPIPPTRPFSVF